MDEDGNSGAGVGNEDGRVKDVTEDAFDEDVKDGAGVGNEDGIDKDAIDDEGKELTTGNT